MNDLVSRKDRLMKKIDLEFAEIIKYPRRITVQVDENMEDWRLEHILDDIQDEYDESLGMDGLYSMLEENGINVIKKCSEECGSLYISEISFNSIEDDCDD
jgi:hypothetical protein